MALTDLFKGSTVRKALLGSALALAAITSRAEAQHVPVQFEIKKIGATGPNRTPPYGVPQVPGEDHQYARCIEVKPGETATFLYPGITVGEKGDEKKIVGSAFTVRNFKGSETVLTETKTPFYERNLHAQITYSTDCSSNSHPGSGKSSQEKSPSKPQERKDSTKPATAPATKPLDANYGYRVQIAHPSGYIDNFEPLVDQVAKYPIVKGDELRLITTGTERMKECWYIPHSPNADTVLAAVRNAQERRAVVGKDLSLKPRPSISLGIQCADSSGTMYQEQKRIWELTTAPSAPADTNKKPSTTPQTTGTPSTPTTPPSDEFTGPRPYVAAGWAHGNDLIGNGLPVSKRPRIFKRSGDGWYASAGVSTIRPVLFNGKVTLQRVKLAQEGFTVNNSYADQTERTMRADAFVLFPTSDGFGLAASGNYLSRSVEERILGNEREPPKTTRRPVTSADYGTNIGFGITKRFDFNESFNGRFTAAAMYGIQVEDKSATRGPAGYGGFTGTILGRTVAASVNYRNMKTNNTIQDFGTPTSIGLDVTGNVDFKPNLGVNLGYTFTNTNGVESVWKPRAQAGVLIRF
jgi:hypothetical protein